MESRIDPAGRVPLRATPLRRVADGWALVLASQGIASAIEAQGGRWVLLVDGAQRIEAERVLEHADADQASVALEAAPGWTGGLAGVWVGAGLLAFAAVTGPAVPGSRWVSSGAARASALLGGEPWRAITALTLHVDAAHVVANALAAALFVTWTCRRLGTGLGLAAVLASGALGNALNALWQGGSHRSVGASTALFGALGVLSGVEAGRRWRAGLRMGQSWLPLAAGLALLAMMGTGRGSDVSAHVFGLLAGSLLGLALARAAPAASARLQWLAGSIAAAALLAAWWLALNA